MLLAAASVSAQMRFIYQVSQKTDSTDAKNIKTELANLDISAEKSVFYPENRLKRDSVIQKMRQTRTFDRSAMQNSRSNMDFVIEKNRANGAITTQARILRDEYSYEEDRKISWKILPETTKIGEYKVQKATTNFAGRDWTAWFSTDLPFPDGPYKFSGLPGLIIKIEDGKGDYSFDLKESKKIDAPATFQTRGNIIKIKREAFAKQQEKFRKDPASFMQSQNNISRPMPPAAERGGMRMDIDPQRLKGMQEKILEDIRKNNNPIELK